MNGFERIPFRLALALLLQEGQITISDIEALPFVESERLARAIALSLINRLDVEWDEETVRLTGPAPAARKRPKVEDAPTPEEIEKVLSQLVGA